MECGKTCAGVEKFLKDDEKRETVRETCPCGGKKSPEKTWKRGALRITFQCAERGLVRKTCASLKSPKMVKWPDNPFSPEFWAVTLLHILSKSTHPFHPGHARCGDLSFCRFTDLRTASVPAFQPAQTFMTCLTQTGPCCFFIFFEYWKGRWKQHQSSNRHIQARFWGCVGSFSVMPPAYRVRVHKCTSFLDVSGSVYIFWPKGLKAWAVSENGRKHVGMLNKRANGEGI